MVQPSILNVILSLNGINNAFDFIELNCKTLLQKHNNLCKMKFDVNILLLSAPPIEFLLLFMYINYRK